jgi:predicted P-loop ATPase
MAAKESETDELFSWITDSSARAEWTQDERREALREAGVDPDKFVAQMMQRVSELKKSSGTGWKTQAHAIRDALLEKIKLKVTSETTGWSRQQLLSRLDDAIEQLPAPLATNYGVAFRKFEEASEEDIRSMLVEIAMLNDLESSDE